MADFNFYLNRQGIRGRKGEKGDKGFSPSISIGQNTEKAFTLNIQNEFETFETPNLKEGLVPEDRGGTYVRKDAETGLQYYGEADAASIDNVGVIKIATQEEVNSGEDSGKAVTPETLAGKIIPINSEIQTIKEQVEANTANIEKNTDTITENTFDIQTNKADIAEIKSGMQGVSTDLGDVKNSVSQLSSDLNEVQTSVSGLQSNIGTIQTDISEINTSIEDLNQGKQDKLVQGDNITLTDNGDGTTTISASGGGGGGTGDVTAAGDNVFTGNNRFNKPITVDGGATIGQDTRDPASIALTTSGTMKLALLLSQGLVYTTPMGAPITLVDTDGNLTLPNATAYTVGGIRVGNNLSIDGHGILSADVSSSDIEGLNSELDGISSKVTSLEGKAVPATTSALGLVKPDGSTVTIDEDGTIHAVGGGGSTPDNVVTTDTDQTITGRKTFSGNTTFTNNLSASRFYGSNGDTFVFYNNTGNNRLLDMSYIRTTGVKWECSAILTLKAPSYKFASAHWSGGLNISGDTLTFTKTDGSVVDLLNQPATLQNVINLKYSVVDSSSFETLTKDADTLYRVTTDGTTTAVYLGDIKLSA